MLAGDADVWEDPAFDGDRWPRFASWAADGPIDPLVIVLLTLRLDPSSGNPEPDAPCVSPADLDPVAFIWTGF
jgi:hypothetical protein